MDRFLTISDLRLHRQGVAVSHRTMRTGFSFVELMFAVMIMGIGFIMIAAIFPAGLSLTKSNFDETQAAAIGRGAIAVIAKNALKVDFTNTNITPLQKTGASGNTDPLTKYIQTSMICPSDPRFAWVGYYRYIANTNYAQVYVVVVNRSSAYSLSDFGYIPTTSLRTLEPQSSVFSYDQTIDSITLNSYAAATGTFAIITSANSANVTWLLYNNNNALVTPDAEDTATLPTLVPQLVGRVLKLGSENPANGFYTAPGYDLDIRYTNSTKGARRAVPNISNENVYIVGRKRVASGNNLLTVSTPASFDGVAQDVAIYTAYVYLK